MLHIIWLIIKIILLILLGIIGLALLLILLILFSPIRYKIDLKYQGKAKVLAKVKFLIVSVTVLYDQEAKKVSNFIRIAGIKLKQKDNSKKKKKDKHISDNDSDLLEQALEELEEDGYEYESDYEEGESLETKHNEDVPEIGESVKNIAEDVKELIHNASSDDALEDITFEDRNSEGEFAESDGNKKGKIKSLIEKIKTFFDNVKENIRKTLDNIHKQLEKVNHKVNRFKKFWNMKPTVKTRNYLKKYIPSLFKHILPRKAKGYVHYGFGDACKTGKITGYISLLPFVYQKHFSIQPDFYDKVLEADVVLKGKIRLGYILRIVTKLYIWKCIKLARKI